MPGFDFGGECRKLCRTFANMETVFQVLATIAGVGGIGWFIWWRLQNDEAGPLAFLIKCTASAAVVFVFFQFGVKWLSSGGLGMAAGLGVGMFCGLALGLIWQAELIGLVGNRLSGFYEDKTELEPQPYYSHVEAKRMAGDIPGAVAAVRAELEKFPGDFDGHMRLAALLAEHSEDLPGALAVIEAALRLEELAPGQISYALNTAADWHLKFGRDSESARVKPRQQLRDRFGSIKSRIEHEPGAHPIAMSA